jgi:hypothetical protein
MRRKSPGARSAQAQPIPDTAIVDLTSIGAATLAGAATGQTATLERFQPAGPLPPHTTRLLLVRCPGGFMLFDRDARLDSHSSANPAEAIAVAATPLDLVLKIEAWALSAPPAEYSA